MFDVDQHGGAGGGDLYQQAVEVVMRDRKASTSYIQRRLQIGYNRAASLMERMEKKASSAKPTMPASGKSSSERMPPSAIEAPPSALDGRQTAGYISALHLNGRF